MKLRAADTQETTHTIMSTVLAVAPPVLGPSLPSTSSIKRTIQRERKRQLNVPPARTTLAEIRIPASYKFLQDTSGNGDRFLLCDTGPSDDRILIFGTRTGLNRLANSSDWFADGTFKVTPPPFAQFYTIHAFAHSKVFPLVYCLLPNKTQRTYERMLDSLLQLHPGLSPTTVLTDFELAAMNAFTAKFAGVELHGCLFHLSQNIYRQVQAKGLQDRYLQDLEFGMRLKMIPALSFVPPADVDDAFAALLEDFPMEAIPVADYFEDNYISTIRRGRGRVSPVYPISLRSNYARTVNNLPRSNNAVEAWHRRFQETVGCSKPTLWKFITALTKEYALTAVGYEKAMAGEDTVRQKKYIKLDGRLKTCVSKYNPNGIAHCMTF